MLREGRACWKPNKINPQDAATVDSQIRLTSRKLAFGKGFIVKPLAITKFLLWNIHATDHVG